MTDRFPVCRCERCCPEDPAPTYTQAFKLECLAREVAALPSLKERREWLGRWEKAHGTASTKALKLAIAKIWAEQNSKTPPQGLIHPAAAITPTAEH